jgi:uncharacterized UBP type Zn finger protein
MISPQGMALDAATVSASGLAPPCEHLDGLEQVTPQASHCQDCQASDDQLAILLICLTCGRVACSDDSPHHHAKDHSTRTGHPIAAAIAPGPRWRWCYPHQRLV